MTISGPLSRKILSVISLTTLAACTDVRVPVGDFTDEPPDAAGGDPRAPDAGPDDHQSEPPIAVPECDFETPALSPAGVCDENGWCWENPLPFGGRLAPASPPASIESWFVLDDDLVRYADGRWIRADIDEPFPAWHALARSEQDVWISSHDGLAHYDGQSWTRYPVSTFTMIAIKGDSFGATWGIAQDITDYFCVRFDGENWVRVPGFTVSQSLQDPPRALHVVSDDDVWLFTNSGLHHYVGGTWTSISSPGLAEVDVIHAFSSNDVWFGGESEQYIPVDQFSPYFDIHSARRAAVAHWDGSSVGPVTVPAVTGVRAIGGTNGQSVWFGTAYGELLRFDGERVTKESGFQATRSVVAFAVRGESDVDAMLDDEVGGVAHWDGTQWTDASPVPTRDGLESVWGSAWDDVWAGGTNGLLLHFDGADWQPVESASRGTISGIWGTSKTDVWAVSQDGRVNHFDGSSWTTVHVHEEPLTDIWGTGPASLWITGNGFVAHFDGETFEVTPLGIWDADVWASSDRDVWIAGGPVLHFDGVSWQDVTPGESFFQSLEAIWGRSPTDVWAGEHGSLWHFDGSDWTEELTDFGDGEIEFTFPGSIAGCGEHLWLTDMGRVLVHDGSAWSVSRTGYVSFNNLWGLSPDHLLAVGRRGAIIRRAR